MASQIAHIVYAKKYFDSIENGKIISNFPDEEKVEGNYKINRDEFILGVVFPDIRVIDSKIKRKDTHLKFNCIDLNFSGLTSFEAGWKFHLYCDMRREEILNEEKFYDIEKAAELTGRPAKLLEDELLYDEYANWEKIASYFRDPPLVNLDIDIDRETFVLWYAILAKYIEEKVTVKTMRIFLSKSSKLAPDVDEIMAKVLELKKNKTVIKALINVKNSIIKQ